MHVSIRVFNCIEFCRNGAEVFHLVGMADGVANHSISLEFQRPLNFWNQIGYRTVIWDGKGNFFNVREFLLYSLNTSNAICDATIVTNESIRCTGVQFSGLSSAVAGYV